MIRIVLLASASALAFAVPAMAQTATHSNSLSQIGAPLTDTNAKSTDVTGRGPVVAPQETPTSGGLDSLVPADDVTPVAATPPPSTGNAVLDRLNALEAKVATLEARNHELETAASEAETRIGKVEIRAAKGVQPGVAPTFSDVTDSFSFHPRGTFQIDYAAYHERAGGYDYDDGTDIRRARFGFDGTAWRVWKYRIEAEFVKNTVTLLDAYIQYTGAKNLVLTIGQHKAPYGLEANSSDALNTFLERGMAVNAFTAVGAERRVGASAAYLTNHVTATIGLYGSSEAVQRNTVTRDEAYGVNGRVTWDPILDAGRLVHLGVAGYHVSHFAARQITNLGDRPDSRVDNGLLEALTIGPVTTGAIGQQTRGVRNATYLGGEGALVHGPFSLQGEYDHLRVERYDGAPTLDFDGYYGFATFFLTGESRVFKSGVVDRVKPFNDFNPQIGQWGAFELAFRYDHLNLTDRDLSALTRKATTLTGGLNWYLNPNTRFIVNYIRFKGTNSPLVVAPVAVYGTTAKGDVYAGRMQFDF